MQQNRVVARNAMDSLEKEVSLSVLVTGYPTIETIIDAFKPVYDATLQFQSSNVPMLHHILPDIQYSISELTRIEHGDFVAREGNRIIRTSIYSMRLCGAMKVQLQKI